MIEENLPVPSDNPDDIEAYHSPFEKDLDARQVYICHQYAIDMDPQAAARRCGITLKDINKLLKNDLFLKCAADIHANVLERCDITLAELLNELKRIAFFDVKGVVNQVTDSGVEFHKWEDIDGRAIQEVKQMHTKDGITYAMIKPHRKLDALKTLLEFIKDTPASQHIHIHKERVKSQDPEEAMDYFNDLLDHM